MQFLLPFADSREAILAASLATRSISISGLPCEVAFPTRSRVDSFASIFSGRSETVVGFTPASGVADAGRRGVRMIKLGEIESSGHIVGRVATEGAGVAEITVVLRERTAPPFVALLQRGDVVVGVTDADGVFRCPTFSRANSRLAVVASEASQLEVELEDR